MLFVRGLPTIQKIERKMLEEDIPENNNEK